MPLKIHTEAIEGLDPNLQVKGVSHFAICQWLSLRLWTPTARMHHCSYYSAFIYFIIIQSNHSLSSSVCIFTSPKDVFKWKFCTVINLSEPKATAAATTQPKETPRCNGSPPGGVRSFESWKGMKHFYQILWTNYVGSRFLFCCRSLIVIAVAFCVFNYVCVLVTDIFG